MVLLFHQPKMTMFGSLAHLLMMKSWGKYLEGNPGRWFQDGKKHGQQPRGTTMKTLFGSGDFYDSSRGAASLPSSLLFRMCSTFKIMIKKWYISSIWFYIHHHSQLYLFTCLYLLVLEDGGDPSIDQWLKRPKLHLMKAEHDTRSPKTCIPQSSTYHPPFGSIW